MLGEGPAVTEELMRVMTILRPKDKATGDITITITSITITITFTISIFLTLSQLNGSGNPATNVFPAESRLVQRSQYSTKSNVQVKSKIIIIIPRS